MSNKLKIDSRPVECDCKYEPVDSEGGFKQVSKCQNCQRRENKMAMFLFDAQVKIAAGFLAGINHEEWCSHDQLEKHVVESSCNMVIALLRDAILTADCVDDMFGDDGDIFHIDLETMAKTYPDTKFPEWKKP